MSKESTKNNAYREKEEQIIIGITGGLASGKTTAADMFTAKGAVKIDADEIAHRLLKNNNLIKQKVIDFFGTDIITDDEIDRRKLAKRIFFNKENLKVLCRIMHPEIIRQIKEQAGQFMEKIVVIDAPLLIETGLDDFVDVVVVVAARETTQIKRATNRGIPEAEAKNIIQNQMPLAEKIKFADYIIDNMGNLNNLKKGVDTIWKKLRLKEKKKN